MDELELPFLAAEAKALSPLHRPTPIVGTAQASRASP